MKLLKLHIFLVIGLCFGLGIISADDNGPLDKPGFEGSSFQAQLNWVSINSGGIGQQASSSYMAGLSCGQVVSGVSASSSYRVSFGFWQTGVTAPTEVIEISDEVLPTSFGLSQNYPNPFNPTTVIEFTVPRREHVRLEVYNLLGQRVITLVDEAMSPGTFRATWDGTDGDGRRVASGVYLARITADNIVQTRKMILMK